MDYNQSKMSSDDAASSIASGGESTSSGAVGKMTIQSDNWWYSLCLCSALPAGIHHLVPRVCSPTSTVENGISRGGALANVFCVWARAFSFNE